ncbi:Signal transduction histidine kinase [Prauserella marina]|uniref:Oxygen sensor histidine kinase NreB n=1 Tax=Prauserella marina TaxID=530584 RepID=A0A1G6QDH5_9PSEU|nr:signal transduction histidine kinase [Prauserella marina]SDC90530.1 Signal transduction histidine kinase [Prauserella marina]
MVTAQAPITRRMLGYWELFYALVYIGAAVAALLDPGYPTASRIGSVLLLAAQAAWYWLAGHRPLSASDHDQSVPLRAGLRWFCGALVLFCCAILLVGASAWVTPALLCQTFWLLPFRIAAPSVVLVSFAPTVRDIVAGDSAADVIPRFAPAAAIFAVLSLLLGYVLTRIGRDNEKQAELIASLEASRAEVARLSHEAGTSAERERLAREIHDTLAQGFTSIVALTQAAESELDNEREAARRHLALATRTARENLAEARAMVGALTPTALGSSSLAEAVRRQAKLFTDVSGTAASCTIGDPLPTLETAKEVVLLRAVQEALANVRRHAAASTVEVRLLASEHGVMLSVHDDGKGFAADAAATGFGLAGMRSRAEQVGGTLTIHSGIDEGTKLVVEVPS